MSALTREIDQEISALPEELQRQVLDYIRQLRTRRMPGVPGPQMVRFAGMFTAEEADAMLADINAACGQIDHGGW